MRGGEFLRQQMKNCEKSIIYLQMHGNFTENMQMCSRQMNIGRRWLMKQI